MMRRCIAAERIWKIWLPCKQVLTFWAGWMAYAVLKEHYEPMRCAATASADDIHVLMVETQAWRIRNPWLQDEQVLSILGFKHMRS